MEGGLVRSEWEIRNMDLQSGAHNIRHLLRLRSARLSRLQKSGKKKRNEIHCTILSCATRDAGDEECCITMENENNEHRERPSTHPSRTLLAKRTDHRDDYFKRKHSAIVSLPTLYRRRSLVKQQALPFVASKWRQVIKDLLPESSIQIQIT